MIIDYPLTYIETLPTGPSFEMILVEGGTFDMGSNEAEASGREKPVHRVRVSSFYMGKYPVTQGLWQAVMGDNPSHFQGDDRPVEQVSWNDTQAFLGKLNKQTGQDYRLPSEAEWEFAARGGIHSEGYLYAGSDKLKQIGWYGENSGGETHPVGLKMANELGIYDLSGNVREWCEDDWHDNYKKAPNEGSAWMDKGKRGRDRVRRGGSWYHDAQFCRVSCRYRSAPEFRRSGIGFRLVLSPSSRG